VRVLEARFHPRTTDGAERIVVARVICGPRTVDIRPDPALAGSSEVSNLLIKLRYLVEATKPDCVDRLLRLKSSFWTFVEIPGDPVQTSPGARSIGR
jgi:hypothetical protein